MYVAGRERRCLRGAALTAPSLTAPRHALPDLQLITPFHVYFNTRLILQRHEFWRLATNFFYFGNIGERAREGGPSSVLPAGAPVRGAIALLSAQQRSNPPHPTPPQV